jgi:rubrerythrin
MSTLDDLAAALNGETTAAAKYLAFAARADEEGYSSAASLFRAAAAAEKIHAKNHAQVLKSLGGVPNAVVAAFDVGSTRENLAAAIQGETYERDVMYPEFIKNAEGNKQAVRTLSWALEAEKEHARLYQQAADDLESWRSGRRRFWICQTCGYTVDAEPTGPCPVCEAKKEKFQIVD